MMFCMICKKEICQDVFAYLTNKDIKYHIKSYGEYCSGIIEIDDDPISAMEHSYLESYGVE